MTKSIEGEIYEAYQRMTPQSGQPDWVELADILPTVSGTKQEQTKALIAMMRTGDVNLVPESNQQALTGAQRAAAVRIGGEDLHLIWIMNSYRP